MSNFYVKEREEIIRSKTPKDITGKGLFYFFILSFLVLFINKLIFWQEENREVWNIYFKNWEESHKIFIAVSLSDWLGGWGWHSSAPVLHLTKGWCVLLYVWLCIMIIDMACLVGFCLVLVMCMMVVSDLHPFPGWYCFCHIHRESPLYIYTLL